MHKLTIKDSGKYLGGDDVDESCPCCWGKLINSDKYKKEVYCIWDKCIIKYGIYNNENTGDNNE